MKAFVVRFLLVIYCLLMAKPALPFASDFLAHAFWRQSHYEQHDHHHGHDHVHEEVQQAADEEKAPLKNPIFEKETLSVHLNSAFDYRIRFAQKMNFSYSQPFIAYYSIPETGNSSPPPEC